MFVGLDHTVFTKHDGGACSPSTYVARNKAYTAAHGKTGCMSLEGAANSAASTPHSRERKPQIHLKVRMNQLLHSPQAHLTTVPSKSAEECVPSRGKTG